MTMDSPKYIGHFVSCAVANQYVQEFYKDAEYTSCLHEDYIYMPKEFIKKEIE